MSKCRLNLPHTTEFNFAEEPRILWMLEDNMRALQRWADNIMQNGCCCSGSSTAFRQKCGLHIPYLRKPSSREMFDNYLRLERWAAAWASGECCSCTNTGDNCYLHVPHKRNPSPREMVANFQRIAWWANDFVEDCCPCTDCTFQVTEIGDMNALLGGPISSQDLYHDGTYLYLTKGGTDIWRVNYPAFTLVDGGASVTGRTSIRAMTSDGAGTGYFIEHLGAGSFGIYQLVGTTVSTITTTSALGGTPTSVVDMIYGGDGNLHVVNNGQLSRITTGGTVTSNYFTCATTGGNGLTRYDATNLIVGEPTASLFARHQLVNMSTGASSIIQNTAPINRLDEFGLIDDINDLLYTQVIDVVFPVDVTPYSQTPAASQTPVDSSPLLDETQGMYLMDDTFYIPTSVATINGKKSFNIGISDGRYVYEFACG